MPSDPAARAALSRLATQAIGLSGTMIIVVVLSGLLVGERFESGPGFALRAGGLFLLALPTG